MWLLQTAVDWSESILNGFGPGLFSSIGSGELILVLVVVLILFGPKQLPNLARTLGKTMRGIRQATDEIRDEIGMDDLDLDPRREFRDLEREVRKHADVRSPDGGLPERSGGQGKFKGKPEPYRPEPYANMDKGDPETETESAGSSEESTKASDEPKPDERTE